MTAPTPPPCHSKPVRLAAAALTAAIDDDWRRATDAVSRLNAECGGDGLWTALLGWCDTVAAHAVGGTPEFGKVRVAAWTVETGAVNQAVPERTQWAMDLIAARANGDLDMFTALVQRLNDIDDGLERGRYVSALLESAALTIRHLPRGYAARGGAR